MAKVWKETDTGFVNSKGQTGVWVEENQDPYEMLAPVNKNPADKVSPIYGGGKGQGGSGYMDMLNEFKAAQQAEYDRQRREYEKQQARLRAQQLAAKQSRDNQINEAFNNSKLNLDNAKNNSLKDSYVAYMRGLKNMPQISAVSGNGGYAQSLANKQQLNYENNRTSMENQYLENLRQLEQERNAGLAASQESYVNGLMGLETNAQNYLDRLDALRKDEAGYADQMSKLIKDATPKVSATKEFTGKYKVGNETMSRSELIDYLIGQGMTAREAAWWMEENKIPY